MKPDVPEIGFLSTVHPHPWAPQKGTFNRAMLSELARSCGVAAIIPVPWTERVHSAAGLSPPSYPVATPTFWFLPRLAPLALAASLEHSVSGTLRTSGQRPDVILSYWADPDGTTALRWARRIERPLALIVGGSDLMVLGTSPRRGRRILETIRGADLVLAVGSKIHETLLTSGLPLERLRRYRRGVNRERFRPMDRDTARRELGLREDRATLLWVGRMVPVKGLDILLEAITDRRLRGTSLVLVGDGPLRARLNGMAERLGVATQVTFAGPVAPERLAQWYAAADLVVLPSRSEGVPNVLLEAIACGRPFVATDVGGIRDICEAPEHDLVPPNDPAALADRLVERLQQANAPDPNSIPDARASGEWLANELRQLHQRWGR